LVEVVFNISEAPEVVKDVVADVDVDIGIELQVLVPVEEDVTVVESPATSKFLPSSCIKYDSYTFFHCTLAEFVSYFSHSLVFHLYW